MSWNYWYLRDIVIDHDLMEYINGAMLFPELGVVILESRSSSLSNLDRPLDRNSEQLKSECAHIMVSDSYFTGKKCIQSRCCTVVHHN